jgi:DHA1 family bicyclomycin/chloramphenicol resistance-like MFS transporter
VLFQSLTMGCFGLMVSNFGAMAMEPVGAVAGAGASLQGFVTTSGAAIVGALIGKSFDGSTVPFTVGAVCCGVFCLVFVLAAEEWKLFKPHAGPPHGRLAEGPELQPRGR